MGGDSGARKEGGTLCGGAALSRIVCGGSPFGRDASVVNDALASRQGISQYDVPAYLAAEGSSTVIRGSLNQDR